MHIQWWTRCLGLFLPTLRKQPANAEAKRVEGKVWAFNSLCTFHIYISENMRSITHLKGVEVYQTY